MEVFPMVSLFRLHKPGILFPLAALATASLAQTFSPHHYKLVDLGTFGGPNSSIPFVQHVLTNSAALIGEAESNSTDPFDPQCSSPNCKVQNGFEWRNGIRIKLSGLAPQTSTDAEAINPRGTIAGGSRTGALDPVSGSPVIKATLWRDGHIVSLGTFGGLSSGAMSISSNELVTGWSQTADGVESHAFLWVQGKMRDLGTLGGQNSAGLDVNDRGQVVGFSDFAIDPSTGQPTQHPFFWDRDRMIDIGLGGSFGGSGLINGRGQAIGDSLLPGDAEDHAFLWSEGKVHDLGTLGGSMSLPTGLTENADISGVSWLPGDEGLHAVLWIKGAIHDLGAVAGDECSWAWALNSSDQVVGISVPSCDLAQARAFLWDDGVMVDLNTLIRPDSALHLVYAMAINDAGVIAGIGVPPGISPGDVETLGHAYLLIPQVAPDASDAFPSAQSHVQPLHGLHASGMKAATGELTCHLRQLTGPRTVVGWDICR
jgi:probable HAF family extracellular repeat protein